MAHLFIVLVYDSFHRKKPKISTTYYFLNFSLFMSQDDAHYQNHLNAPHSYIQIFFGEGRDLKTATGRCTFDLVQPIHRPFL